MCRKMPAPDTTIREAGENMKRPSVYVPRMLPQENLEELQRHFDVEVNPDDRALSRDELKQ